MHSLVKKLVVPASVLALALPVMARAQEREHSNTRTPIKHVIVIFQENVSFDHYFGTYPNAEPNKDGSRYFRFTRPGTPEVNNLQTAGLLTNNPNGVNPFRIDRSNANTCDQDHGYGDEQYAFHGGLMDRFLLHSCNDAHLGANSTMGYYDGNTVTALWNYAQHFAMSDNSFNTTFGPSSPGAVNLISGQTHGIAASIGDISGDVVQGTLIGDADPLFDECGSPDQVGLTGKKSAICSTRRALRGDGSRAGSATVAPCTPPQTEAFGRTTFHTTSHSSTTPRQRTLTIFVLPLWR